MFTASHKKPKLKEVMLLNFDAGEESPLDCKEIKPVSPKGNHIPEYSLEGLIPSNSLEAEAPKLWPPDVKS